MSNESIADAASGATYAGAALSAGAAVPHYVFGLTLDEWSVLGIIFGMLMAFAGWIVNLIFKRMMYNLTRQQLQAGHAEIRIEE